MKRSVANALNKSLQDEEKAIKDRFERAETVLNPPLPPTRQRTAPEFQVIRDSFTFPDFDYRLIEELKLRAAKLGLFSNKGEVLRAGLHLLSELSDEDLAKTFQKLVKVKVGRRASE
jgi:hypothetical protein